MRLETKPTLHPPEQIALHRLRLHTLLVTFKHLYDAFDWIGQR